MRRWLARSLLCFDYLQYRMYLIKNNLENKVYRRTSLGFVAKKRELYWLDVIVVRSDYYEICSRVSMSCT
ncbi:unnamed protein product, partial [Symbiodinium sp. KB8]